MAFLKPQNPMTKGSDYFYPLTTADQVIMDGGYRLDEIVGKTKKSTIMLYANGWSAEAPYCFSIAVQGLSDKVNMKMLPHFPEDFEGKQAMKEETAKISFATREGNILTFECWDEVPTMDLPIDIEIEAMYPIKGASIEINYSVVGGVEEPAEPTENMIWVNTDQNITDWVFSKNEPKNLKEGMIWFATGDNSNVSFFTLRMDRREFDEVYPISAKQYVSGVWVNKAVKSYQDGKWVEWIRHLFNNGDQCVDITGGWTGRTYTSGSRTFVPGSINSSGQLQLDSNGTTSCKELYTKNKISKGSFSRLYFNVANATNTGCVMLNTEQGHSSATAVAIKETNTAGTYGIDLTGTEDFYVVVYNATGGTICIDEIWME